MTPELEKDPPRARGRLNLIDLATSQRSQSEERTRQRSEEAVPARPIISPALISRLINVARLVKILLTDTTTMPSNNSTDRTHTATAKSAHPRATILATSPAMTPANAPGVRGDCYDVRDMYTACVQLDRTGTPICDAVVSTYLQCSQSEK